MTPSPPPLFASLFIAFVAWLSFKIYARSTKRELCSLPCVPNAKWLWGHELEAHQRPSGDFYTEWIDVYGPTFRMKGAFGHKDILVLADPLGVGHLYRNIYNYPHSPSVTARTERMLGRGLVWVEGQVAHRRMRRLVNPAFTPESVKLMTPTIYESAGKMQARIASEVLKEDGEVTVNIVEFSSDASLDVIGKVGFDHEFGQGASLEAEKIAQAWKTQVAMSTKRAGFIAVAILRLFPFLTSLPVEAMQAQGDTKTVVKQIASKIIDCEENKITDRKSLLSILMRASFNDKDQMSKDDLLDQICTFVISGHETTAGTLSYTLWELARHPEKQKRLREEVSSFAGNPTYDEFQSRLSYLDACCKEGLRMHPAVSQVERVVENEDVIPLHYPFTKSDGTKCSSVRVEKGQVVYVPTISINRLKSVWGDGETFRPERWLNPAPTVSDVKFEGWSNILSFADGPRNCVGYRLAVFELKAFILTLVRNFVFHDTEAKIVSRFAGTLQPSVLGRESQGTELPLKITFV